MKLWLDDVRLAPEGWVHTGTVASTLMYLRCRSVGDLSLDHDLGGRMTGMDLLQVIQRDNLWPTRSITVHSMNPVGKANMEAFIERWAPERLRKGFDTSPR